MSLDESYQYFEEASKETEEWLTKELAGLRTGRITPDLVDKIQVESYGSRTQLNSLASISNSDARTLVVSPWDEGTISAIEKAIAEADLGIQPVVEGKIIRLVFPSLTDEVRDKTIKQLHNKVEEARVRLRQARDEGIKMQKEEKEKVEITEDDVFSGKKKLDEKISEANVSIEASVEKKEADIASV
jgi:ribosome recycling factor